MKTAVVIAIALLSFAFAAEPARAEGDPERGKAIAYSCFGCHAIDGYRNAYPSYRVPKLGGQTAAYMAVALRGYRNGTRAHDTMVAQAQSLSDQDIDDVSAYLAALGPDTLDPAGSPPPQTIEQATTCVACHGQAGIGVSPTWPTLAGQHESYLIHALNQYREGLRTDPVMMPLAQQLSDADVRVLAAYYASLDGLETIEVPDDDEAGEAD